MGLLWDRTSRGRDWRALGTLAAAALVLATVMAGVAVLPALGGLLAVVAALAGLSFGTVYLLDWLRGLAVAAFARHRKATDATSDDADPVGSCD